MKLWFLGDMWECSYQENDLSLYNAIVCMEDWLNRKWQTSLTVELLRLHHSLSVE